MASDPYMLSDYPLENDQVKFLHYGDLMTLESIANAAFDGLVVAYIYLDKVDKLAHQSILMPQQEYKRSAPSYEISLGSDLYAVDAFTVDGLQLIMRVLFRWGQTFQPREFEFQWARKGRFHVTGWVKKGVGVFGEVRNGTTAKC